jgi:hypothetical protein
MLTQVLLHIFFETVPVYSHTLLPVAILLPKALLQTPSCNLRKWNCCDKGGLTFGLTERAGTYFITLENVQNSWITVHSFSGGFFLYDHLQQGSIEQGAYIHNCKCMHAIHVRVVMQNNIACVMW